MLALLSTLSWMSAADTALSLMTFNLRYGTAADGDNAWPHRKETLVNAIKQSSPDIIGVQECLMFQAEYIANTLPEYHWLGIGREADGGGEMAAVFYRKNLLNPVETDYFWLSETPGVPGSRSWDTACTRMATHVRFWHRKTGLFFDVLNTHLDHESEAARVNGCALILSRANGPPKDAPVIVMGDFNADAENSAPWNACIEAGFADSWLAARQRVGPEITHGGFHAPNPGQKSRIDWILVRGPIQVEQCETVVYHENGRYPSDHFPVLARITIAK